MAANVERADFGSEGVVVTVQPQKSGKAIRIVKFNPKKKSEVPATVGVFSPGRLVINVGAVEKANPDHVVTTFDPPMVLRVRYTKADLNRAGASGTDLKLGFFNEELGRWIVFTAQKHRFRLEPDPGGNSGVGVVEISHWGDPQVAWNP
jgi:hypothetical protein